MTPTVNNEAASRLRDSMYDLAVTPDREAFLVDLDAALAAERRGTVERIREQLLGTLTASHEVRAYRADVEGILDAEASR